MSPNTIKEVELAIGSLTPREIAELYAWLDEHHPQAIDARVASDLAAGRHDSAIQRALDDERSGRVRPF